MDNPRLTRVIVVTLDDATEQELLAALDNHRALIGIDSLHTGADVDDALPVALSIDGMRCHITNTVVGDFRLLEVVKEGEIIGFCLTPDNKITLGKSRGRVVVRMLHVTTPLSSLDYAGTIAQLVQLHAHALQALIEPMLNELG